MEKTLLRHREFMKYFSLLLLFLNLNVSFAQDTLRNHSAGTYSEYYVINADDTFEYYFAHCTGVQYGQGHVNKNLFNWKFIFDSIPAPTAKYNCSSQSPNDKISFVFKYLEDSLEYYSGSVKVNETEYSTGDYTFSVNKSSLNFDGIQLEIDNRTKLNLVGLDSSCSEITVYRPDLWHTYKYSGETILKKKDDIFFIIKKSGQPNPEKPRKKGETRKHTDIYKFN